MVAMRLDRFLILPYSLKLTAHFIEMLFIKYFMLTIHYTSYSDRCW